MIDFSLFWKIAMVTAPTAGLGALGFLKDFGDKINETRRKIQESAGTDPVSGEPYKLADGDKKLIDYPLKNRLYWLLGIFVIQMLFTIIYLIFKDVHVLSESNIYANFISLLTYLGLFPTLVSAILFLRLAVYAIQMRFHSANNPE